MELPATQKSDTTQKNLVVSIDAKQNYFIGTKKIAAASIDSILSSELQKRKQQSTSTPVVIINADTAATFGRVFRLVQIAKKDSARVFFNVRQ